MPTDNCLAKVLDRPFSVQLSFSLWTFVAKKLRKDMMSRILHQYDLADSKRKVQYSPLWHWWMRLHLPSEGRNVSSPPSFQTRTEPEIFPFLQIFQCSLSSGTIFDLPICTGYHRFMRRLIMKRYLATKWNTNITLWTARSLSFFPNWTSLVPRIPKLFPGKYKIGFLW